MARSIDVRIGGGRRRQIDDVIVLRGKECLGLGFGPAGWEGVGSQRSSSSLSVPYSGSINRVRWDIIRRGSEFRQSSFTAFRAGEFFAIRALQPL